MVPLWMFANAIACGNCFVLKPSEKTPSASMLLAELWRQAGLPDGVFSVVHGDREAVDTAAGASAGGSRLLRRLHAGSPVHLRDGGSTWQASAGTRRGEEPHDRAARCRHRHGCRCRGVRWLRLKRGAVHGYRGRCRRRGRGRSPRGCDLRPPRQDPGRGRHGRGRRNGPARDERAPGQSRGLLDQRGRGRRRRRSRWPRPGEPGWRLLPRPLPRRPRACRA